MNDDDLFSEVSELYRRESRNGALASMDPCLYDRCRIYLDFLLTRLAVSDPDSEERDSVYGTYMSVSRLFTDIRRLRVEKICLMAVTSVFGGRYDESCMTEDEREMSESIRGAVRICMGVSP